MKFIFTISFKNILIIKKEKSKVYKFYGELFI